MNFFRCCLDCAGPRPYCGKNGCNLFGCNCQGGCRINDYSKRDKRNILPPISPDFDEHLINIPTEFEEKT